MNTFEELLPLLQKLAMSDGQFKSLNELSEQDGRSPWHLQRLIKAETGESPLQFSRRIRLQRSAATLVTTDKSVLDVAFDAGFESHESFTRAFRATFNLSPSGYRQKFGYRYRTDSNSGHALLVNETAPCVSLFRSARAKAPSNSSKKGSSLKYTIEKKKVASVPFLYMSRQVKPEAIAEALASIFGPVFQYVMANGIQFAGRPTARYASYGPGLVTLEAGMPIVGTASVEGELLFGSLYGGEVATTTHKGPYENLNLAHEAIQYWIKENKEQTDGAPWEAYVTDPGEVPNPADWITEVTYPLK